ncbi:MAG: family 1 glycosylhydrolase, partial [Candidatus Yanofskybacteria bacterium]|nr:family 1 glycosylhydrolase [Candidatus Yanofskybacteria bacterium]
FEFIKVRKNFIEAQALAYREIKNIYDVPQSLPGADNHTSHNVEVGLVENNTYSAQGDRWYEKMIGKIYNYQRNLYFWDKALPYYDFLGLNYYHIDRRVPGSYRKLPKQGWMPEMGWETYPKGIYHRLMELKKFKKPVYIIENGIADGKDEKREKFIEEHLRWVWQAIHDGADVRGYMYWSLLDNFEWARGFKPKFGLVEVDFNTFERNIRPSAFEYAKICKDNTLSPLL